MLLKVLVIDDHEETRSIIAGVLRDRGFTVKTAVDGKAGLRAAADLRPHLVVVDGMMPGLNGWEFTERFRQQDAFDDVPIIMFSAAEDVDRKLRAFNAGVDDYMIKPIQPAEFLERVDILLTARYGEAVQPDVQEVHAPPAPQSSAGASQLIGVLGSRGGSGATTLAINLAAALAASGRRTVLVDMDLHQGHITTYLKIKAKQPSAMTALADLGNVGELKRHLPNLLVPYQQDLAVLPGALDKDGRIPTLTDAHTDVLLDALLGGDRCVVIDMGLGRHDSHAPIFDRADDLLLCVRPERVALAAARHRLGLLRKTLFPSTRLHAVLIDFYGGVKLPADSVSQFLGQAPATMLHTSAAEMTIAVNKSQPLVTAAPDTDISQKILRLALQLVDSKPVATS